MLATFGAGICVMLSGYATGGQLGFPLAAASFGVAAASLALGGAPAFPGALGVAIVGLGALLLVGRYFGSLDNAPAILLLISPLLGWLPEVLLAKRVGPRGRGVAGVLLATVLIAFAVTGTGMRFAADWARPSSSPGGAEPSIEDYLNFGK
jgi:hypothetical protein